MQIRTFILAALAVFAVGYALWVAWWFTAEGRRSTKPGKSPAPTPEPRRQKPDIVGKSRFVLPGGVSQPQAAIAPKPEPKEEKADIFAPASVPEHPRQIAPEELDDLFGEAPEGEPNEPLDIDIALDGWPSSWEEDDEDGDGDGDEIELLPTAGKSIARGVSFEQMSDAYRHVVHNPELTVDEQQETGRILLSMKGTDLYKSILSGKPERERKVANLIDAYLAAFRRRSAESSAGSPSPQGAFPQDFDVRDYV